MTGADSCSDQMAAALARTCPSRQYWGSVNSTRVIVVVSALAACAACGGSREPLRDGVATSPESPTTAPVGLAQTAGLQGQLPPCLAPPSTHLTAPICFSF